MAEPPVTALAASMALIREVLARASAGPQQLARASAGPQQQLARASAGPQQQLARASAGPQQQLARASAGPQQQLARASAGLDERASKMVDATLTTIGSGAESEPAPATWRAGRAAVAIIVREDADERPEILLIRRAERSNDPWSGHMAFPGGREEPQDTSLLATALRETREEIALDLERAGRLLGQLQALPAVARGRFIGMEIVPFVFELTDHAPLAFNPDEVSEAIWIPLEPLRRGALRTTVPYELGGQRLDLPAHDFEGRIVWGLTYRMLDQLFALLG